MTGYEDAIVSLKNILFDIILAEEGKLSNIEYRMANEQENLEELSRIRELQNSKLNEVLRITGMLFSSLENLSVYTGEYQALDELADSIENIDNSQISKAYRTDLKNATNSINNTAEEMSDSISQLDIPVEQQEQMIENIQSIQNGDNKEVSDNDFNKVVGRDYFYTAGTPENKENGNLGEAEETGMNESISEVTDLNDSTGISQELPSNTEVQTEGVNNEDGMNESNSEVADLSDSTEMPQELSSNTEVQTEGVNNGNVDTEEVVSNIQLPVIESQNEDIKQQDSLTTLEEVVDNQVTLLQDNKALAKDENSGIIQKLKFVALNNATTRAILTTKKQVENLRNSRETQKALLNVRGSIASNSLAVKTTEAVTQQINDLEVSEQQLIDNGLLEPTNVDKQKQIEEMLEKANSLYREGKAQDALDLYNQISLLNKELQGDKATVK
ncbi:MAG: hypothetical protein HFJ11_04690 [Bacilli bacterium]|nr:hypothetical protein [Bacilli bacterium]